jgi:hypothetical protein
LTLPSARLRPGSRARPTRRTMSVRVCTPFSCACACAPCCRCL